MYSVYLFVKALKRLEYTPNTSSHMTILVLHVTGNISLTTAVTTDTQSILFMSKVRTFTRTS